MMTHNVSSAHLFAMHTCICKWLTLRLVFSVLDIIVVFTVRYFLVKVCNSYVRWLVVG